MYGGVLKECDKSVLYVKLYDKVLYDKAELVN